MSTLQNKIDFAVIVSVKNANPNGDPLNGNRPRIDYEGRGEISDVCIKRKIRDRLMENGLPIFVQSDEKKKDNATSLSHRAKMALGNNLNSDNAADLACEKWLDVRAFGQLFAFSAKKESKKKSAEDEDSNESNTGVSIPIRGPVSIHSAFSKNLINITSTQITKSVNSDEPKKGKNMSSDRMGMKHRVDNGIYVFYGSMNPQLAEKTKFTDEDANAIKQVLPKLFENDASSARPEGSMEVLNVFWWNHGCRAGKISSAKVHNSLQVNEDGTYSLSELPGLKPEIIPGF